jgi:NAD(P)-dependent dehydrogenase (short-subunit alcohol dehydrogenase family)
MAEKKIALITGGNKGIGYGLAKKLAANNYTVWIGCRNKDLGLKAQEELRKLDLDVTFVELDVTNQKTIDEAAKTLQTKAGKIDLLINNAGIYLMNKDNFASKVSIEGIQETFDVNFYGVIRVTQAFLPLLHKSTDARIYNVSSGLGSVALQLDPATGFNQMGIVAYNTSKSALNMVTAMLANELKESRIMVNCLCPGYTATDLNNHSGPQTVEESVAGLYNVISNKEFMTGHYFRHEGGEHPW